MQKMRNHLIKTNMGSDIFMGTKNPYPLEAGAVMILYLSWEDLSPSLRMKTSKNLIQILNFF